MLKHTKKIAFDIDGVLRNLMFGLDRVYLCEHPEHAHALNENPHVDWDLSKRYPIGIGIYDFLFIEHPYEIFTNAPVFQGALECFNKCRDMTTTGIITSQAETTAQATLYWLAWNGFKPDFIHIVYQDYRSAGRFNYYRNITKKPEVDDDIYMLIDDHTTNLTQWRAFGRECVCIDRGYNQDWDGARITGYGPEMYERLYDYIVEKLN